MTLIKQISVLSPSPASLVPIRFIILLNISWRAAQNVGNIIIKECSLSTASVFHRSERVDNCVLPVTQKHKGYG